MLNLALGMAMVGLRRRLRRHRKAGWPSPDLAMAFVLGVR
jgi:hypothetical protein